MTFNGLTLSSHRLNLLIHSSIIGHLDVSPQFCAVINNTLRYSFVMIVDYILRINSQKQDFGRG